MATIDQLRAELQAWQDALNAHDSGDFRTSLRLFAPIADTSKIILNVALIHDRLGERSEAIENLNRAIELDKYLAVGYFQRGGMHFHAGQFAEALEDFMQAATMMRANVEINYDILGLNYKLKLSEVLFNRGLTLARLGRADEAATVLRAIEAEGLSGKIARALKTPNECYPCSLPAGILYRPSATKMQLLNAAAQTSPASPVKPSLPSLHTEKSSTYLPSVSSRKYRKRKTSIASSYMSSPLSTTTITGGRVPKREELSRVIGVDMTVPHTDITSTPCAGVRVSHGQLAGLMAWRFIVQPDAAPGTSKHSSAHNPPPAVVVNFLLDTGSQKTFVPQDACAAIGLKLDPGTEVTLRIQGVRTRCVVADSDDAGRVGVSFMTAGSLSYYFDAGIVAPVLYDGSAERPSKVPRTIRPEDLPRRKPWILRLLSVFAFKS
ncbi:NAD(P)H oxidase regulator [Mycena kentingensis (nom. inval.)]|nr:NAD(P)H oxidase regulator [Mycena kentingensis (nom. inval.)]